MKFDGKDKRYLITSADERTWKFDRPVIFLGDWCCRYDRKDVWSKMDAIVAEPYGLLREQKQTGFKRVLEIEKEVFPFFCETLNRYHNTTHSDRFWRILLGHWFRRFVSIIFNRVNTLEQCLANYDINGITVLNNPNSTLAASDTLAACWAVNDEQWNNYLYSRVITLLGPDRFPIEVLESSPIKFEWGKTQGSKRNIKSKIVRRIYQSVRKVSSLFVKETDAFIITSYLPIKEEVMLQLALKQFPQIWTSPNADFYSNTDNSIRRNLSSEFLSKNGSVDTVVIVLYSLLFESIPICFLEGFAELKQKKNLLKWPDKPKFIFTSNNFDTDEVFKLWAAQKTDQGVKYITGQHGNAYGTSLITQDTVEEMTADKFVTWGWSDKLKQHRPAFIFRYPKLKKTGGTKLTVFQSVYYQQLDTWDSAAEWNRYFEEQKTFLTLIDHNIRLKTIIRLHSSHLVTKNYEPERFREWDPTLNVDPGLNSMVGSVAKSRLVVFSVDSTGILEMLSQNVPMIAFWQNGLDHVRESAKPYYKLLIDAGIVHLTPESAAGKVNEVWDNVNKWWMQDTVQTARAKFCDRYAKVSNNRIQDIKSILLE